MQGQQAGWYRDPAPANRAAPTTMRFWDGQNWTAQVKAASRRDRREWELDAVAQQIAQSRMAATAAAGPPGTQPLAQPGAGPGAGFVPDVGTRDHTPDGRRRAGWWARVAATLVDLLLVSVLCLLFGWHFVRELGTAARGAALTLQQPTAPGAAAVPDPYLHQILHAYLMFCVVAVGVRFVYDVGFLKGFQATPGKMALGLEVRLADRPGVLSWGTVLVHWVAQRLYQLVAVVPLVGPLLVVAYGLLDPLWPLWDGRRQTLHDKAARTTVVTSR